MRTSEQSTTFLFAAGGTGGHLFPALAVAEALKKLQPQSTIVFVGSGKPIETEILSKTQFKLETIPFVPFSGRGALGAIKCLAVTPFALVKGISLIRRIKPAAVIGFGGYPSFIPFLAARLCGLPRILHEQNVKAGLANRVLGKWAKQIIAPPGVVGFDAPARGRLRELSNPVRAIFETVPAWSMPAAVSPLTILITGGSQGAVRLNSAVLELLPLWKKYGAHLIHITGALDLERVTGEYQKAGFADVEICAFSSVLPELFGRSHLVICRAGAGTAAEVTACGRPAIYVPLEIASAHQVLNVQRLAELGAAIIVPQTPKLPADLRAAVEPLLANTAALQRMAGIAASLNGAGGKPSAEIIAETLLTVSNS